MSPSWRGSIRAGCAAALAVLLVAASASAQARGPAQGAGRGPGPGARGGAAGPALLQDSLRGPGPIELLLGRRADLHLTEAQVSELERIAVWLRNQNAPLLDALLDSRRQMRPLIGMHPRDMAPAQRALFARQAERARPLIQQLQRNNARAMNRVGQVLTGPQRRQLRLWLQQSAIRDTPPGDQQRLRLRGPGGANGTDGSEPPGDENGTDGSDHRGDPNSTGRWAPLP
jgi:hypothetical protein